MVDSQTGRSRIIMGIGVLLLMGSVVGIGRWWLNDQQLASAPAVVQSVDLAKWEDWPSPLEPSLYRQTIPYLRSRNYQSQLVVDEVLADTAAYKLERVHYDSDGLKIYGLLSTPKSPPPVTGFPAVILVHGYLNPATYQTNGSSYQGWWQTLASANKWVVFKIDLRGHGESEGYPSGAYYSSDYVVDTLNARAALRSYQGINAGAVGLWGHSMAGNILMRTLAAAPDIPAVSIWAGAGFTYRDLATYRISDSSYVPNPRPSPTPSATNSSGQRRRGFARASASTNFNSDFWQAVVPANYLNDFQGALQLQHAVDDTVVNVSYSRDLAQILTTTSVPHQYFEYPTGGHNMVGGTFGLATARLQDFFKQYLVAAVATESSQPLTEAT